MRLVIAPVIALVVALVACSNPAPTAAPSPSPANTGTVRTEKFASAALGVDKQYLVYLPTGYDAQPQARWPVFYYLHGLMGDETNWVKLGHLDAAAGALGLQAIVVMPDGDDGFYANAVTGIDYDQCMETGAGLFLPDQQPHRTTCVRKRDYETYIVKDLIAEVDRRFRTIATREGRAIAGLSMGGFGALELAMRHPDLFAAAASHSGVDALLYAGPFPYRGGKVELVTDVKHWGATYGPIGTWIRGIFGDDLANWKQHDPASLVAALQPGALALYLDCGTEDGFMLNHGAAYLHDLLLARKIDHEFFLGPGEHDFSFWVARLPKSLAFLRDHTATVRR